MQSILAYLENVLANYWGQSKYQLFLYIAIIVILLMETESWKKITFGWYGIICFIVLLNPVTVKLTSKFWEENIAYNCRQFSLIPIFIIIAYAIVLVLKKINFTRKIPILIIIISFVIIVGNQIYGEGWYTQANNWYKIPDDVVEISNYFEENEETGLIAAPTSVSSYLRQYSNMTQIQGRYALYFDIERADITEKEEVIEVFRNLSENACDYLIVHRNNRMEQAFQDAGYEKCFNTTNYLIYKVTGFERWKRIYDAENRVKEKKFIDNEGLVQMSQYGYADIRYTYDKNGNVKTEHYYDEEGKAIALEGGQYATSYEYDKKRKIKTITYWDENDCVMKNNYGYARITYIYDNHKKTSLEHYYDEEGKAIALEGGQYATLYEYDGSGKIIQKRFLDKDDETINSEYGYAVIKYEYDKNGNEISEHYYDANLKPVALFEGQYGVQYEYDENNNLVRELYLDNEDNIM